MSPQADEQFLSLALDPAGSAVYAGTGTVGSVYKIGAADGNTLQGTFQSTVHDAGVRSRWGTLAWTADTPPGTSVTLQTRSGDVERPDDSWSAWSAPYATASGQAVTSPPARYIQYQAVFTGDAASVAAGTAPRLRDVSLYYLPRNRPPTVSLVKPGGGDAVSKAALLQWSASDPDKDTLTYDVSYSSDGGKTWTPIKKRATPGGGKPAAKERDGGSQRRIWTSRRRSATRHARQIMAQVQANANDETKPNAETGKAGAGLERNVVLLGHDRSAGRNVSGPGGRQRQAQQPGRRADRQSHLRAVSDRQRQADADGLDARWSTPTRP